MSCIHYKRKKKFGVEGHIGRGGRSEKRGRKQARITAWCARDLRVKGQLEEPTRVFSLGGGGEVRTDRAEGNESLKER